MDIPKLDAWGKHLLVLQVPEEKLPKLVKGSVWVMRDSEYDVRTQTHVVCLQRVDGTEER